MITLTIGNSYSRLEGMTAQQEKIVRDLLSCDLDKKSAYFSGNYRSTKRCLVDKKGNFPTGLLHRLPPWALKYADARIKPKNTPRSIEGMLLYSWQSEAASTAILRCRGIVSAPTGTGKSRAMASLIWRLNVKTLVIVPSLEIKKQLIETFKTLGIENTVVENIDSKALNSLKDFDCLIIDEAHHVAAKTYRRLNKTAWQGIFYRYFFTATPFRNDTEETLLFESIAGQVIYNLDYQTAIRERYIVPVEAYYIEVPKQKTDAYSYQEVYRDLVVNNTARNYQIAALLTSLHAASKSTLCLVREVAHGKLLSEMTGLPFVSGDDDDSRKYIRRFNDGGNKVIIATTGIMGEGIDSRPCEFVVIAGLGKAKSQFMQQVGRAVRTYPGKESAKVILFKDKSHKFLSRHFNAQVAILSEEYGIVCHKLEV